MYGKIVIRCDLVVKTGMHIGGSNAFSAIGAVDSPVIRDAMTGRPIVPGSSLKGKLRSLLAKSYAEDITKLPKPDEDQPEIRRLFGSANPPKRARAQFADCFVSNFEAMKAVGLTEVKSENVIDRISSQAMPRQIERVNPGTVFGMNIVYDVEDEQQVVEDMTLLAKGMRLLQLDYLGGHGTRGSGRVSLQNFRLEAVDVELPMDELQTIFSKVEQYELFPAETGV